MSPSTRAFIPGLVACPNADGSTFVLYDMQAPGTEDRVLSLRFTPRGSVETLAAPAAQRLPKTGWLMDRRMRSDTEVELHEQLEDTPLPACLAAI
jgi:carotenoid 1,2-hydratase